MSRRLKVLTSRALAGLFLLLGGGLLALVALELLAPADSASGPALGFTQLLPQFSLGLMWLAVGMVLLKPHLLKPRRAKPDKGDTT